MDDIKKAITDAIAEEYEYFAYIRDDNLDIGSRFDYQHGVFQGQVQAAERIMSKVLKIINADDEKGVV